MGIFFDIFRCSIKRSSIQIVSCVLSGNITRNMIFQIFTHSFVFLIVGVNLIDNIHGNSDKTKKKPLDSGKADTYFKSQSYQGMVIMNGSGEPISEKKMSAFSVEDHKNGDKSKSRPPTWRIRTRTKGKQDRQAKEKEDECECGLSFDEPVCGKDGITYPNSCVAKCHGIKIMCRKGCPCDVSKSALNLFSNRFQNFFGETFNPTKMMKSLFSFWELPTISNTSKLMTKEDREWLQDKKKIRSGEKK